MLSISDVLMVLKMYLGLWRVPGVVYNLSFGAKHKLLVLPIALGATPVVGAFRLGLYTGEPVSLSSSIGFSIESYIDIGETVPLPGAAP